MVQYDEYMADRVVLPDEAPDMTVTELHASVVIRLYIALRQALRDRALVLVEIFLRVDEREQVSPDLLIVPGARPGARTVYRVPDEPVPDVTIEVLSPANHVGEGRRQLERKRELLGRIGVPLHIEIDPDRGLVTTWHNVAHLLVADPPTNRYDGDGLGGLRLELIPGQVTIRMPDGREFIDANAEMEVFARLAEESARLAVESARDAEESARREAEACSRAEELARREAEATARAARLAEALREAGIDPESV